MKGLIVAGGQTYREIDRSEILEPGDADLILECGVFYPIAAHHIGIPSYQLDSGIKGSVRVRKVKTAPDIQESKSYTDRDLIELACRAPAVPDWFEPDMGGLVAPTFNTGDDPGPYYRALFAFETEQKRQKLIQWPKAYARMVLESK